MVLLGGHGAGEALLPEQGRLLVTDPLRDLLAVGLLPGDASSPEGRIARHAAGSLGSWVPALSWVTEAVRDLQEFGGKAASLKTEILSSALHTEATAARPTRGPSGTSHRSGIKGKVHH